MTHAPSLDDVLAVMSAASVGDATARVALPDELDLEDPATRLGVAVNLLLDDLAFRIGERERVEEQLRQAQKMEAVGSLAGGIAHDFNNLLSVILSYASFAQRELRPEDPLHGYVTEILRAGDRAAQLTRQLLAFSRKQLLAPTVVDLNVVLTGMEAMLRRLLGEGVTLSIFTGDAVGNVFADAGQLEQVVMNLAVNARDAMPDGGMLTIETDGVELDEAYASLHPEVTPGPYVRMTVTDTGVGMDASVRQRIFEPFFTTKEPGRGTGLGLATVFGIVRQTGGHIWVYSEPGSGSTFKLYLPRTDAARSVTPKQAPAQLDRGTETILLVEDDEQVRAVARAILARSGYVVLEASSGGEALRACREHAGTIDLLLTDVVMPRMSGRQVVDELRPMQPELKVVYMSGYTDRAIVHHGVLDAGIAFVPKPITPEALLRKVREVLDGR